MKKNLLRFAAAFMAIILMCAPVSALAETSYTYVYDFWGEYQECPDAYSVSKVLTSSDLGLEVPIKQPEGLYVKGNYLYLLDTGNNRIIELNRVTEENLEVVRIIDSFNGGPGPNTFAGPTDMAISEEGNIFIADKNNSRILKLDADLNYIMEFTKPNDATLDPELTFLPSKLVIDTAERVYCIATGINKGLVKYEPDGVFSGFVGATPVVYDFWDYIWKFFASQEQRAQMKSFVPTEYDNLFIDREGFIYTVQDGQEEADLRSGSANAVRKLNLLGSDILTRNGYEEVPIIGDIYFGSGGGYSGPSLLTDVTVFDNDIYCVLDKNRGRVFAYDEQGRLVYAFGGNGNMDGYFRRPTAIEHIGYDLFVLDYLDCAITIFTCTDFGKNIYQAVDAFDLGLYDEAGDCWQRVMDIDGNYYLAYIGIGRSLLRQKKYKEAMEYFKLKYDVENYSKAFKQYRKEWVEDHIIWVILLILALFLIPGVIKFIKKAKYEIKTAEYFK